MAEKISLDTVLHVAEIARLKLSDSEAKSLQQDLNKILGEFSKISQVSGKGEETHYIRKPKAQLRKDEPVKTESEPITAEFNESEEGFMSAPKSME